jgi:hypothetical protein
MRAYADCLQLCDYVFGHFHCNLLYINIILTSSKNMFNVKQASLNSVLNKEHNEDGCLLGCSTV